MFGDIATTIISIFLIIILTIATLFIIYIIVRTFVIVVRNDIRKRRTRERVESSETSPEEENK